MWYNLIKGKWYNPTLVILQWPSASCLLKAQVDHKKALTCKCHMSLKLKEQLSLKHNFPQEVLEKKKKKKENLNIWAPWTNHNFS